MSADVAMAGHGRAGPDGVDQAVAARQQFWLRSLPTWDVAVAALLLLYAATIVVVPGSTGTRVIGFGSLAAIIGTYLFVARPGMVSGRAGFLEVHLAVLTVAVAVSTAVGPSGYILLFVAYSQIWCLVRSRRAGIGWSALLAGLVVVAVGVVDHDAGPAWRDLVAQMAASLVFAVTSGLWITRIIETSTERAGLLERLEAAQADLAASERAAGMLSERERLAQEIHDTLAQGFTSVVVLAQTASALLDRDDVAGAAERLTAIEQVARDNLAEARAVVTAFGPAALADTTLDEALRRLADRFTAETGTAVDVDLDPAAGVHAEAAVVLLRAAQEGLANVRRHANATRVVVRLTRESTRLVLEVVDDGRGLPTDLREGYGLTGMRDRAAAAGGRVELGTGRTRGTRLCLTLPARS